MCCTTTNTILNPDHFVAQQHEHHPKPNHKMGSSTNTIHKLTRWRVRNMAACFFACKISESADSEEQNSCTSPIPVRRNTLSFDPIGEDRRKRKKKKGQKRNKNRNDKEKASTPCQIRESERGHHGDESSRYCSKEDDQYIVFSFDSEKQQSDATDDKRSSSTFEDIGGMKIEESIKDADTSQEGKVLSSRLLSARESSDSIHSDTSTGSFAFPVVDPQFEMGMDGKPCSHAAAK